MCHVNFTRENVTQFKSGITINVDVRVKIQENIMRAKKIISGILVHVLVKMVNICKVLLVIQ